MPASPGHDLPALPRHAEPCPAVPYQAEPSHACHAMSSTVTDAR